MAQPAWKNALKSRLRQRLYAGGVCLVVAPLCALAAEPNSMTVYRSVGPDGVVSFSDSPQASAVPIELVPPPVPLREEVERANQLYEQQLALLEILETSRHARAKDELEQQRLELDYVRTEAALQRQRDREQQQAYENDYYPLYAPLYWGSPRPPWGHPPGPRPPPTDRPPPPSKPPQQIIQWPH
jgi:hypothetical protein